MAGERPGAAGLAGTGEAVPGFYVALELVGDGQCCRPGLPYAPLTQAVVRATATGAVLAAVTAPHPYGTFTGVTAAADNRTFVLAAQKVAQLPLTTPPATRFFLLRIDPAGRVLAGREPLTPLPVPEQPPGRAVSGLALSPDAARLAVTAGRLTAPALRIFSLATGDERVWDGPGIGPGYGPGAAYGSLSWDAAGQTLALITSGIRPGSGVRLLDATAPSSRLLDSSRLVLPSPAGPGILVGQLLAPGHDQRRRPGHHCRSPARRPARQRGPRHPETGCSASGRSRSPTALPTQTRVVRPPPGQVLL